MLLTSPAPVTAPAVQLRPYQVDAVDSVLRHWRDGTRNVLGVAATGAGKTVILLEIIDRILRVNPNARVMLLAHRQELIDQPVERAASFYPDLALRMGVVMADRDQFDAQVIVASIATIVSPKRLSRILATGQITHCLIDEAHHSVAESYVSVVDRLIAANPDLYCLGVTATPKRTDRAGLRQLFSVVAFKYGIKELVKLGYLVPFKALAVETAISLKGVRVEHGDFKAKDLAGIYEVDNCFDLVVESHQKYAGDRPAIAFTASVEGAYRLAEKFTAAGIPAAAADGTTPRAERAGILRRFRAGEIRVLCNCALFGEGLDIPEIACVHMVRPTRSDLVYTQAIGRGLRPVPGKDDCLILDYVPVESRDIVLAGDLLGKPREQRQVEAQAQKAGVVLSAFSFTGEGTGIDGDTDELVTRPLNYLSLSPYAWYFHDGLATLGLGANNGIQRTLALKLDRTTGSYDLVVVESQKGYGEWVNRLAAGEDFAALAEQGIDYAETYGSAVITARDRAWQKQAPTEAQLALLHRLLPKANGELTKITRGEATKLISNTLARRALIRRGWRF